MAEHYVRPPLVAREPKDPRFALWRFRVVSTVLLVVLGFLVFVLLLKALNVTEQSPGFGVGLQPSSGTVSTALVPRG